MFAILLDRKEPYITFTWKKKNPAEPRLEKPLKMAKKKKREAEAQNPEKQQQEIEAAQLELPNGDSHKKKKKKKNDKKEGDKAKDIPTLSIALPGSIIDNTQSYELATRVFFSPLSFPQFQFSVWLLGKL